MQQNKQNKSKPRKGNEEKKPTKQQQQQQQQQSITTANRTEPHISFILADNEAGNLLDNP
jgi:hypothetical protein